jgi:hypothetical protein
MSVKTGTFGGFVPSETTTTETAPTVEQQTTSTETSTTSVTETGSLQTQETTPSTAETTTQEAAPTQEQDENTAPAFEFNGFEPAPQEVTQSVEAAPQTSWKDLVKQVDKKELFKELGYDDSILEFAEHRRNGGDPYKYLEARTFDWNKVDDLTVIRDEMRKQYPAASNEELDLILNHQYSLNEDFDESLKAIGSIKMKNDAVRFRNARIEEQKKFVIQDRPENAEIKATIEQQQALQREQAEQIEQYLSHINSHEATKSLIESKKVGVDIGDGKQFYFPVNRPDIVNAAMTDAEIWQKIISDKQGKPDVQKLQGLIVKALNPNYEKDIYAAGVKYGMKHKLVEDGQNAQRPTIQGQPPAQQQQVAVVNKNGQGFGGRR